MKHIIIAGTNKAGTTSLFEYLGMHPDITNSNPKQTLFFMDKDYKRYRTKKYEIHYDNNPSDYYKFFNDSLSKNSQYLLEASPDYMYSNTTCEKLLDFSKDFNVELKLIFILRDPIDRMKSWFKYGKQINLLEQELSFSEYVDMQTDDTDKHMVYSSKESGCYSKYLQPFLDNFSDDQIYLINLEDLKDKPHAVMDNLCDFLNIRTDVYSNFEFKVVNQSVSVKYQQVSKLAGIGRKLFRNELGKLRFEKFYNLLKTAYRKMNHNEISNKVDINQSHITHLHEYFLDEYALLNKAKL